MPTLRQTSESISDFVIESHGSIVLLRPLTESGRRWVEEKVRQEGFQPIWPTVLIEPRYVTDILRGIAEAGLAVRS